MRKILVTIALLLLSHSLNAQWRKIAEFQVPVGLENIVGEYITSIYFLDLPGPPRIGFVGTEPDLWKTTNGGTTWLNVGGGTQHNTSFEYYVTDICFKDSLTGWFSMFGGTDACYRTTDGGNSWTQLRVPDSNYGAVSIYYNPNTNRLFLGMADGGVQVSTDIGNTWHLVTSAEAGGFSFWNDSMGIASAYPTDSTVGIMRTTDGGLSWILVDMLADGNQPLAIPGTSIGFEADRGRIIIRRSDDYGQTWRVLKDFGPLQDSQVTSLAPYGTGMIRGDLSRLYIQTDSGIYVSIDSGYTWKFDGGPTYFTNFSNDRFYSVDGITFAGMTYGDGILKGGGLWEEIWPTSGVAERADTVSSFRVFPNPAGSSVTVEGASGPVAVYDPLGRSCTTPQPPPWKGGGVVLDVSGLPSGMYFVSDGVQRTKFIKE